MTILDLKRRLDRVDRDLGNPRLCTCQDNTRVVYGEGYVPVGGGPMPETPPLVCPVCGGERDTIFVEYTNDWRPQP